MQGRGRTAGGRRGTAAKLPCKNPEKSAERPHKSGRGAEDEGRRAAEAGGAGRRTQRTEPGPTIVAEGRVAAGNS